MSLNSSILVTYCRSLDLIRGNPIGMHGKIIKYINEISYFVIQHSNESSLNLVSYYDVDWAGNYDNRKSPSGMVFFLGNNIVP